MDCVSKAQHNLKQKEELRIITDTLAEGIYVIDERGIIQEVNSTACEILGYTKSELLGKEAHELFHTHARNDFLPKEQCPVFEALMEKRAYYSEEEFFTCNDGTIIPVILKARPLIREAEKTLLVIAFYNNAEAYQHHATMRLLQQALEASSNAVVITNKEAVIKWANHAFEILTGFCVGEALAESPKSLLVQGCKRMHFMRRCGKPFYWETHGMANLSINEKMARFTMKSLALHRLWEKVGR